MAKLIEVTRVDKIVVGVRHGTRRRLQPKDGSFVVVKPPGVANTIVARSSSNLAGVDGAISEGEVVF